MFMFLELNFNKIELLVELDTSDVEFYLKIYIEHFEDIKFHIELDFVKIEFQNMGISLNSFKIGAICYIVFKLRVNTHFYLYSTHE